MARHLFALHTPQQVDRARDHWLEPDEPEPNGYCSECEEPLFDDIHTLPNGEDCCEWCCQEDDCVAYRLGDSHAE